MSTQERGRHAGAPHLQYSVLVRVTQHATLDRVLDQLRDGPSGNATLRLDPLSVLFATPDHFRALDAVRIARRLSVTIEVADAHRTGLALAFGYRVRPPGDDPERDTAPVNDVQFGPPNRTGAIRVAARRAPLSVAPLPDDEIEDVRLPQQQGRRHRRAIGGTVRFALLGLCLLLSGIVGCTMLVVRVHTADVTVQPAEQPFSQVVPFAVSVTPTNDPNTLSTTLFETTIAREGDAAATGKTSVPDGSAAGLMTFRSRADGATTLKAGTALKGPHDVSYLLESDVVVPGLNFIKGQLGEVSGKVHATQPGPAGNLAAGFSARYTDNVTYISGEITGGTEKQVAVVTEADIAGLRDRLEGDLRMHALTEANAALPSGATALNDYLTLRPPVATAQPPAGTQADSVHLRLTITAQVPVYQNADFDALIDRGLTAAVRAAGAADGGVRRVLPETVVKSKPVFVDVQGPLVRYFASVTGTTRAVVTDADLSRIRDALAGRDARGAEQVLSGESALGGHTIRYGPSWLPALLRERMPRRAANIHIRVGMQT
ncbi:MAG: hypothetical protein M3Y58_02330 [Chloroflexota bacterium]|nr:hypothetical protein [Chloroflexota bacterium]